MAHMALILGGVRSGKSRFAQDLAQKLGGDDVLFVATAEARDAEMSRRIQIHQTTRPLAWTTLESAQNVGAAIAQRRTGSLNHPTLLIDCLTLLVSNVLLGCGEDANADIVEQRVAEEIQSLLAACDDWPATVIIVSGEVGLGVVPESALGRQYRDLLGWANQAVAARSTATYLMVAGLPIELKSLAKSVEQAATNIDLQN